MTPTVRAASSRALGRAERQAVLDVLHSERFVDQSPAEAQATLLEEHTYLCSTRTMYRILDAAQEVRERRDQARHPVYARPELVATAPNQIWSWDITKLKGPIPYLYYSLYVILDLFNRYVVGWMVAAHENARPSLAAKRVSPHVLRHTCALTVLQATKDLRKVSLWLGHAHLQTTEIYTRADPSVKLETLEAVMPPTLRSGRFKATDKLIASLTACSVMRSEVSTS